MSASDPPAISVIVPALNEGRGLQPTLERARQTGVVEIIVVDGGSNDETCAVAERLADLTLTAARGRASQMNAGAARASGDVLLFLHADTLLPADGAAAVRTACSRAGVIGGRFDVRLQPATPLLWLVGSLMNLRSRLSRIATGDQAIFIRRDVFQRLGGYTDIPLMEDLDLSRRMTRVVTSSRRWRRDGALRTILRMWTLRLLYFLGVSPARLARFYADTREERANTPP
jgi:rSAM/selenodomain-associated transferase 2